MHKIIINYTDSEAAKRLVLNRDLPYSEEVLAAVLYLHAARVVTLNNILPVTEVYA